MAPEGSESLLFPCRRPGRAFSPPQHSVVPDGARHAAGKIKDLIMSIEQGFLLLSGRGHQKRYLGVAPPSDEDLDGEGAFLHNHHGFAEIGLGIHAGLIGQRRDEDRTGAGCYQLSNLLNFPIIFLSSLMVYSGRKTTRFTLSPCLSLKSKSK